MIERKDCRQIGFIAKVHGINGEMVLRLFNEFSIDNMEGDYLFLDIDGGLVPFYLVGKRNKNESDVLIKLEDVKDEVSMQRLIDIPVHAIMTAVSEEVSSDFSMYQLVGYKAFDKTHGFIGEIDAIREIKNNPLFEVINEGKEILIPITEDFITEMDDNAREIHFDLPEGLIDME